MRGSSALGAACLLWALAAPAAAHQPVMDMAPRWEDGFGFQVRHEWRHADDVIDRGGKAPNPDGGERRVHTTWFEGIYTFQREVRATFKIPYVDQERDASLDGRIVRQSGRGIGDAIFALPLRKYWNLEKSTMNVGLTPQLRVPTGSTSDSYPVGDGSWDMGLSASFSSESFTWYTLLDVFYWNNTPGSSGIHRGNELGVDLNLGYHVFHDPTRNLGGFVMLDAEARYESRGNDTAGTTGGHRVTVGPVLVGYWQNWMLRGEMKIPLRERAFDTQLSRGVLFNVGLGVTF